MKFCNMAVVVPVDQLTGSKAALSAQVWGQVSNLLMPALGKLYRQFHPANDAWGHKLTVLSVWCWAVRSRSCS